MTTARCSTTTAASRGVRAVLHPHVGTMIETGEEVRQVLDGSRISLCLDTGHLLIGGTDPAELRLDGFTPDLLLEERLARALRARSGDQAEVAT